MPSVEYCIFTNIDKVDEVRDFIFVSKKDCETEFDANKYKVVFFEAYFDRMIASASEVFCKNIDYYYLSSSISNALDHNINSIITGASYSLFGIDKVQRTNMVNLSSISQDLYYSLTITKMVCKQNKNIRNVVLCMDYYYLFYDLSRSENFEQIHRISNVYAPLLGDLHNCIIAPHRQFEMCSSNIFDTNKFLAAYCENEIKKGYFTDKRTRKNLAVRTWGNATVDFENLTFFEKDNAGKVRANQHGKHITRINTLDENKIILQDFLLYCNSHNITFGIAIVPTTLYYRKYAESKYKDIFYEFISGMNGTIHILDLSENDVFCDEDFVDADHMSDSGSTKFTKAMDDMLFEMSNER